MTKWDRRHIHKPCQEREKVKYSDAGIELTHKFEGWEKTAYKDSAGLLTIGCGHLLTKDELSSGKININGMSVVWTDGLTNEEILQLLLQDISWAEEAVNEAVTVPLTQNQFDALVDFIFNVGAGAFKGSTLLKLLNQGDYASFPEQCLEWCHSGGRIVTGLVTRRRAEVNLWNQAQS